MTEDAGWRMTGMRCDGAAARPVRQGGLVTSGCSPAGAGEIAWHATFVRVPPGADRATRR